MRTANPNTKISAGAERMRRSRQRQRLGLACVVVEVKMSEIDALVRRGFIRQEDQRDYASVVAGLHRLLDETLRK